jgi:hypothetical protein
MDRQNLLLARMIGYVQLQQACLLQLLLLLLLVWPRVEQQLLPAIHHQHQG